MFVSAAVMISSVGAVGENSTDNIELSYLSAPNTAGTNQVVPNNPIGVGDPIKFPLAKYPNGSYFSKKSTGCTCHSYCNYGDLCDCISFDLAIQCDGFARYIYNLTHPGYYVSKKLLTKDKINVNSNFGSVAKAKSYLLNTPKGTYIRVITNGGRPHSIAVVETTDYQITLYHANYDGKCKVEYKQYTWQEFISKFPTLEYYIK